MGTERYDRSANPLAAMMDEELADLEVENGAKAIEEEAPAGRVGEDVAGPDRGGGGDEGSGKTGSGTGYGTGYGAGRRAGRRRGRPRGGRNSDPNMVPISARIHKDVRFAVDRVLAEQSELQGRPVYMAEVIERLLRFYVEEGDPYEVHSG